MADPGKQEEIEEKTGWFAQPGAFQLLMRVFFISLGLLIVADFFIDKHAHFYWEEAPGFFAAYGLVSCVVLVMAAKVLRLFIKRDEDYYDR